MSLFQNFSFVTATNEIHNFDTMEAFPKLQFWGDKLRLSSNLKIRSFARMKS
jgi:hypothetical protein